MGILICWRRIRVDNSIMRVMSKDIAGELMEITFGDNDREVRCNVND